MTADIMRGFFLWSFLINMALLFLTFAIFCFGRNWVYRMHTKWFKISRDTFDALWYGFLGFYKTAIIMLNLVPYLALLIVSKAC
ncbi:MAG: hypothetical protein JW806_10595 [Sedimentisphaerales bacterium]|nr:hypothetical protein [Sedimentisphaerales bacterium]